MHRVRERVSEKETEMKRKGEVEGERMPGGGQ